MAKPVSDVRVRFSKRFAVRPGGCWEWTARVEPNGYAKFMVKEGGKWRSIWAHIVSYTIFRGEVPTGLQLDHICRNRSCVNPEHLRAVTQKVNILSSESPIAKIAARQTCANGHAYTEENTRMYRGMRYCRTCKREHDARYRQAKRYAITEPAQ
jgi:hypothetical protein